MTDDIDFDKRETVWVIERDDWEPGRTHYYSERWRGRHDWTPDVYAAKRFASRSDAEALIGKATGLHAREHIFGLRTPLAEAAAPAPDDQIIEACAALSPTPDSEPPAATKWQPIETAPENKRVLLCDATDGEIRVGMARWGWTRGNVNNWSEDGNATHWMPLPAAPAPAKEDSNAKRD